MPQYQNCLKKFNSGEEGEVMLYLARAQYEADQFEAATRTILKALHLFPTSHTMRFNAGLVLQKYAAVALRSSDLTVAQVGILTTSLQVAFISFYPSIFQPLFR